MVCIRIRGSQADLSTQAVVSFYELDIQQPKKRMMGVFGCDRCGWNSSLSSLLAGTSPSAEERRFSKVNLTKKLFVRG